MSDTTPETVLVELTDEERAERAFELAENAKAVLAIEEKRTAFNKEINTKLKALKTRIRECADAYDSGVERRPAQQELPMQAANGKPDVTVN